MATFFSSLAGGIVGGIIGVVTAFAVMIWVTIYQEPENQEPDSSA
jgi:predicted PurR-regulated permease PerM